MSKDKLILVAALGVAALMILPKLAQAKTTAKPAGSGSAPVQNMNVNSDQWTRLLGPKIGNALAKMVDPKRVVLSPDGAAVGQISDADRHALHDTYDEVATPYQYATPLNDTDRNALHDTYDAPSAWDTGTSGDW